MQNMKTRGGTCRSSLNDISVGVVGMKEQPGGVVSIGVVEVGECHFQAAQNHLPRPSFQVHNRSYLYYF